MNIIKIPKAISSTFLFFALFFGLIFGIIAFEKVYLKKHIEKCIVEGGTQKSCTSSAPDVIDNFWEGLWYAVVTITSVGYGDYTPQSVGGKVIGFLYVLSSIGLYGYFIAQLSNYIAERNHNNKMGFNGTKLEDHTIILGWDHYARLVTDQLISVGGRVAIITSNKDDIELIREHYHNDSKEIFILYSEYDNYDLLKKCNFLQSKVVFVNTGSDADKLVTILNLRKQFQELNFIANIDNADLKETFKTAGVTHPLSKHDLSSKLLASYIFEPDVATMAEELMTVADNDDDNDIKEYIVVEENIYVDTSYDVAFYDIKRKFNSILLGISKKQPDGSRILYKNPDDDMKIELDDYIIVITTGKNTPGIEEAFAREEGI